MFQVSRPITPCRSFTFPISPHSTIPPHPVGSSKIWRAAITMGSGKLSNREPPPARRIPLRMQPTARSPSTVRVLSESTSTSHDDIKATCKSLHKSIQLIPPLCEELDACQSKLVAAMPKGQLIGELEETIRIF
jgi:hypothetical protein